MIDKIEASGAKVLLLGMLAPPNWGEDYQQRVRPRSIPISPQAHHVPLYPFFLEGVAMDPDLNQPDGLHPNERGVARARRPHRAACVARLVGGCRDDVSAGFAAAFAEGDPATLAERCLAELRRAAGGDARHRLCQRAAPRRSCRHCVRDLAARHRHRVLGRRRRARRLRRRAARSIDRPAAAVLTARVAARTASASFAATDDPGARPAAPARALDRERAADARRLSMPTRAAPICARRRSMPARASGAFLVGGLVSHRCEAPLVASGAERGGSAGRHLRAAAGARCRGRDRADPGLLADRPGAAHRRGARQYRHGDRRPPGARRLPRGYRPGAGAGPAPRSAGSIFAGLPVAGSDTGDYLVRNLMAIDPRQGWIVLGAEVAPGDQIAVLPPRPGQREEAISRGC